MIASIRMSSSDDTGYYPIYENEYYVGKGHNEPPDLLTPFEWHILRLKTDDLKRISLFPSIKSNRPIINYVQPVALVRRQLFSHSGHLPWRTRARMKNNQKEKKYD